MIRRLTASSFNSPKDIAVEIVLRKWQKIFHSRFRIDLNKPVSKLGLPQPHYFSKAPSQTFLYALVRTVSFTEPVDDCSLQCRREIRRWLRRLCIVPNRQFVA